MDLQSIIKQSISKAFKEVYELDLQEDTINLQPTRKEFEGTFTLVTFPFAGRLKLNPELVGNTIGDFLTQNTAEIKGYNVLKGFLNLVIEDSVWVNVFNDILSNSSFGQHEGNNQTCLLYTSPSPRD